jgi:uncharacterized membrane protein
VLTFFARIEDEPRITLSHLRIPALVAIVVTISLELFLGNVWSGFYGAYMYFELDLSASVKEKLYWVSGLHSGAYQAGGLAFVGLTIWVIVARFRMRRAEKKKRV